MAYDKTRWRGSVDNGNIPLRLLDKVYPGYLDPDLGGPAVAHPEAALAIAALLRAAKTAGHGGLRIKYSYRTLSKQWEKWRDYQNGGNLAAYPGTSNHGWAVSFDLNWRLAREIDWAHANAARFGFSFDVPSEDWHATYQGGFDTAEEEMMQWGENFEKGVRAYWSGDPRPNGGPAEFGWVFAKRSEARPTPVPGPAGPTGPRGPAGATPDMSGFAKHPHVHGEDTPAV